MPQVEAKKLLRKAKPFIPPIIARKVPPQIKSAVEKAPKRLQKPIRDELRRVGGMKVR
jgi:hypothetical protein